MKASLVVEGEVCAGVGSRLAAVGAAFQIEVLVLQRAPDPFDEDVVQPAAAPVHRDAGAGLDENAGKRPSFFAGARLFPLVLGVGLKTYRVRALAP